MTVAAPAPRSKEDRRRRAWLSLVITLGLIAAMVLFVPARFADWLKALHVIAIIAWMAAMLYLPRLFVYHTQVEVGSPSSELFKVMERRLLEYIMNPAMVVAWAVGLWLAWVSFSFSGGWLHAKLTLALALSGVHGYFAAAVRAFAEDRNTRPTRHWRIMNEVPTLIMIVMVILVIVKPF